MKISKSHLQQIIKEELFRHLAKEELLKELMGPPKKPPTKIKPKAKPKPLEKSLTFYYLLNDSSGNSVVKSKQLKEEEIKSLYSSGKKDTDEEMYYSIANSLLGLEGNSLSDGIATLKKKLIPMIPELSNLNGEIYKSGAEYVTGPRAPPRIEPDKGKEKRWSDVTWSNELTTFNRTLGDYKFDTLLYYLWKDQIDAKKNPEANTEVINKSEIIDQITRLKDKVKHYKDTNFPYKEKEFADSIEQYEQTLKNHSDGENVILRKYLYTHGFMSLAIVMTGIVRPSKENSEDYEVVDMVRKYYDLNSNFTDKNQNIRQEITDFIDKKLEGQKTTGLKINKNEIRIKKIKKQDLQKNKDTPEDEKEISPSDDDPMASFNKSIKDILGTRAVEKNI